MDTLDKLTVAQLKAELKERSADSKGTKAVLVERLKKLLESEDSSTSDRNRADNQLNRRQHIISNDLLDTAIGIQSTRAESVASCCSSASNVSIRSLRAIQATKRAALMARTSFLKEKTENRAGGTLSTTSKGRAVDQYRVSRN